MPTSLPPTYQQYRRYDYGGEMLRKSFRRTSDGALLCEGIPVREGILTYKNADGSTTRELVTRQAVIDTAKSIARAAVTLDHPEDGFVNEDNFGDLGVGDVDGEAIVEEDAQGTFAKVKFAIRRRDAIEAAEGPKSELSPGYVVTIDPTPGSDPRFGDYDRQQVGRDCNHLAIVAQGRGGPTVRLRADSGDAVMVDAAPRIKNTPVQSGTQPQPAPRADQERIVSLSLAALAGRLDCKIRKDMDDAALVEVIAEALEAREGEASEKEAAADKAKADMEGKYADMAAAMDAMCDAMGVEKGDMEGLKKAVSDMKAGKDSAEGRADGLQSQLDKIKADAKVKADAADLESLQAVAAKLNVKHDGLDLPALRVAVAQTRIDSITADSAPEYVAGVLDSIRRDTATTDGKDGRYDAFRPAEAHRTDAANSDATSLYAI